VTRIGVLHGPNLDRLGQREPAVYGRATLADVDAGLVRVADELGVALDVVQSAHEGVLVDAVWRMADAGVAGFVVNAGGLTHSSVALRDALVGASRPFVEVHLTNVAARERFRARSLLADVAVGVVCGFGPTSYGLGLRGLVDRLRAG
jgi:3-dehydroquinate dehydratase-2